jgi:hypothetical protein
MLASAHVTLHLGSSDTYDNRSIVGYRDRTVAWSQRVINGLFARLQRRHIRRSLHSSKRRRWRNN